MSVNSGETLDLPADPVVSTAWLAERSGAAGLRILDCRFSFDDREGGEKAYLQSHIPGALLMDWTRDISSPSGSLQYMAATGDHFRDAMERLGISDNAAVVGYDDEGGHYVSRLWLIARLHGFERVRLLDGGWTKWVQEGRPVRPGREPMPGRGRLTPVPPRTDLLVSAEDVLAARTEPQTRLVDVRRWTEYTGEEVRAQHGGRIPWAQWLFWQENLNWEGERNFQGQDELRARFIQAGITPDARVIAYCHGGVRAAHTALALTRLGYQHVQVYDGSWEEWGNRDDLPRATGEP